MEYLPIVMLLMVGPMVVGFCILAELMMAREIQDLNRENGWS